ncbi:hypothetical protein [Actinomadura gamaensis]|uniref:Uncharacterized protein n=1 Tax=Actinomadura gamaensis TaxID=1763541 RepID=A0ABV9U2M1_9ACTN
MTENYTGWRKASYSDLSSMWALRQRGEVGVLGDQDDHLVPLVRRDLVAVARSRPHTSQCASAHDPAQRFAYDQ